MKILEGKCVADGIKKDFKDRINKLKIKPNIAILGIKGNNASEIYMKRIQKNCEELGIAANLIVLDKEDELKKSFEKIKNDKDITGIMFQEPISKEIANLINELEPERDIEGIGVSNMGRLFIGKEDAIVPCTSKAVMKLLEFYKIELTGKKVVIVGRSNIVGKPLIPQLLAKNATVTICHSKTKNLREEIKQADVVIIAIGKAKFLKKEDVKQNAIIVDVGINFENKKMVGDVDFEDIKDKALACTPVPGGIGIITNTILIDNIIKSCEKI